MYKLIRFYNQNRKKILVIVLFIVFLILLLQLLNYFTKIKKEDTKVLNNTVEENNNSIKQLISDKSSVSGKSVSSSKLKEDANVIDKFMEYCKNKNVQEAYDLITDECKEEMFPTIEDFVKIYYLNIFNEENKTYTVENWVGDIYKVKITNDILSTGKLDDSETKQDYITIMKKDEEYKININNYVGREKINKTTENKGIKITVLYKDIYMDYELYSMEIENTTKNDVSFGSTDDTKAIYLLDNKDVKYYYYNNEITNKKMLIESKFKNKLKIKFSNTYNSKRNIKKLVFSKVVLNNEEYLDLQDKTEYKDFVKLDVNV